MELWKILVLSAIAMFLLCLNLVTAGKERPDYGDY